MSQYRFFFCVVIFSFLLQWNRQPVAAEFKITHDLTATVPDGFTMIRINKCYDLLWNQSKAIFKIILAAEPGNGVGGIPKNLYRLYTMTSSRNAVYGSLSGTYYVFSKKSRAFADAGLVIFIAQDGRQTIILAGKWQTRKMQKIIRSIFKGLQSKNKAGTAPDMDTFWGIYKRTKKARAKLEKTVAEAIIHAANESDEDGSDYQEHLVKALSDTLDNACLQKFSRHSNIFRILTDTRQKAMKSLQNYELQIKNTQAFLYQTVRRHTGSSTHRSSYRRNYNTKRTSQYTNYQNGRYSSYHNSGHSLSLSRRKKLNPFTYKKPPLKEVSKTYIDSKINPQVKKQLKLLNRHRDNWDNLLDAINSTLAKSMRMLLDKHDLASPQQIFADILAFQKCDTPGIAEIADTVKSGIAYTASLSDSASKSPATHMQTLKITKNTSSNTGKSNADKSLLITMARKRLALAEQKVERTNRLVREAAVKLHEAENTVSKVEALFAETAKQLLALETKLKTLKLKLRHGQLH